MSNLIGFAIMFGVLALIAALLLVAVILEGRSDDND